MKKSENIYKTACYKQKELFKSFISYNNSVQTIKSLTVLRNNLEIKENKVQNNVLNK